ncbi:MAG: hypothetical protein GF370_00585, partial [Candidatus Nealsonbacteria bacterium]|nr:hypothetical protein [Candidatus Nealsonbacteria bacterium]
DIVKTDGENIYFSSARGYYIREWGGIVPPRIQGETKVIKAFPPSELEIDAKIEKAGDMLLHENSLVLFSGNDIYGYDISSPQNPEQKWKMELEENSYLAGARLYNGKVYLVTRKNIDSFNPCPIRPLSLNGEALEVKCQDIYHPTTRIPTDVTYSAFVFDPASGATEKNISFVGTAGASVVYMSNENLYVTYYYYPSLINFFYDFFATECQDLMPGWLLSRLEKLMSYDISETAKMTELGVLMARYQNSLDSDERLRIQNEIQNRLGDYYKEHKRELEKTGIVKINLDSLTIEAHGEVPGSPLNQFALDEYENHLRIATTIGENRFWWGLGGIGWPQSTESANDVYVLDNELNVSGTVKDLGLEERIYSVRFIQDMGYLVTFRQIDPFYVLDLSDPQNPELKGELKIPGYSSYLHPISEDLILGIGKEGSMVKISLFDVSDPENPTEKDKYTLNEYWSDILNTHHAFLLDKKHEVFFLPGGKGGYVFSYQGEKMSLVKAVSNIQSRRAVYLDDYLYVIGDDELVVLNENNWERVNELEY